MDLRSYDLAAQPLKLEGEWAFFWHELLTPEEARDRATEAEPPHYIRLPHSWNGYRYNGETLSGQGYATFYSAIRLRAEDAQERLALRLPSVFTSYKIWVDGIPLLEVGTVGRDRQSSKPSVATHLVFFQPESDQIELVVQASNFYHMRGGMTKYMELGTADVLTAKTKRNVGIEMAINGSLVVIGLYHLLLFVQRRKDRAPLYFGLFTFIWGSRSFLVGEVMLTQWFPHFPWGLQLKWEYLALYAGSFIFTMYMHSLFPGCAQRWFRIGSGAVSSLFCTIVLVTPALVYSHTLPAFGAIIIAHIVFFSHWLVRAVRQRQEGARLFAAAAVFTFLTVINDFLYYNEWLLIGNWSPLGLMVFTVAQMYLLSARYARAATNEERYSQELKRTNRQLSEMNRNLERIVEERTSELSAAHESLSKSYDQLLRSEEGRKKLLSYLTHDLRAPLSSMLGYVEAVQDQVRPERNQEYLKYIHSRTIWLNRMIDDLSYLSHLETRQLSYAWERVDLADFLRQLYERYELVVRDAGLQLGLEVPDISETPLIVEVDTLKLERALSNLLTNAIKFTPAGGTIRVRLQEIESKPKSEPAPLPEDGGPRQAGQTRQAIIRVEDTGIGIHPDELEHIFIRHYRQDQAGTGVIPEGIGLGLAICREIIAAHGGSIRAESDGRTGAAFIVTLPLIQADREGRGPTGDETENFDRGR